MENSRSRDARTVDAGNSGGNHASGVRYRCRIGCGHPGSGTARALGQLDSCSG